MFSLKNKVLRLKERIAYLEEEVLIMKMIANSKQGNISKKDETSLIKKSAEIKKYKIRLEHLEEDE